MNGMKPAAKRVQMPQQARSVRTRRALVEAAASSLVDKGYAGTSTLVVAERAELSQGAVFKHFPVKQQLLAAAVAELLVRLSARFQHDALRTLDASASWSARIEPTVTVLWSIFRSPELRAVYEVYIAARTEPALDAELEGIVAEHRDRIRTLAELLFPELRSHPSFEEAVATIIFAMQGASVGLFGTGVRNESEVLAFFTRLARRELALLAPPHQPSAPPRHAHTKRRLPNEPARRPLRSSRSGRLRGAGVLAAAARRGAVGTQHPVQEPPRLHLA